MKHLLPVCNCVFLYSIQNHFCDNLMSADDFGLLMYGSISNKEQFVWISWTNTDAEVLHTLLPLLPKHQHVIESNTLQWHCARFNWFGVKKSKAGAMTGLLGGSMARCLCERGWGESKWHISWGWKKIGHFWTFDKVLSGFQKMPLINYLIVVTMNAHHCLWSADSETCSPR